jgi:hypothetical protein
MDNKKVEDYLVDVPNTPTVNLEDIGKEYVSGDSPDSPDGDDVTSEVLSALGILEDQIQQNEPEYVEPDNLPEEDIANFRKLYQLSNETLGSYMHTSVKLQGNIKTAKTSYKVDLYTKKFKKLKEKFQDELARNIQLETFFKDNGIEPREPTVEEVTEEVTEDVKPSESEDT